MKRGLIIVGILAAGAVAVAVIVEMNSGQKRRTETQKTYHYPSLTEVEVGFTKVRPPFDHRSIAVVGDKWLWPCVANCTKAWFFHAVVIARNPRQGTDFYLRGGPSEGTGGSTSTGGTPRSVSSGDCPGEAGLMCAVAEPLTERSVDKITEILGRHVMGSVRATYPQVVDRMKEFAETTNAVKVEYDVDDYNSNTLASVFVDMLELDPNTIRNPTKSYMFLPGWNCKSQLETIGPNSIFYPESRARRCR